jgi:hypothetical protein
VEDLIGERSCKVAFDPIAGSEFTTARAAGNPNVFAGSKAFADSFFPRLLLFELLLLLP